MSGPGASGTERPPADGPLVSVLIPTHDRPEWLARAVRSAVDQTFTDIEVVVSNNGDPQHTRGLAEQIVDPRIRWVEYDRTSGMLEHLLSLLDRATGTYVAVLHDDDWWHEDFLAKLVPPLQERDDAVLAFCDLHDEDADGVVHPDVADRLSARFGRADRPQGYHQPFFDVAVQQSAPFTGSLFRRDALDPGGFPPEVALVQDLWLVYTLSRTGGAAYFHRERLLYRTRHERSASSGRFVAGYTGAILCRERMLADPRMAPYAAGLRARLARDHMSAGAALLRQHLRSDGRDHLLRSLRLRPHVKAVGGLVASWVAPDALLEKI